MSFISFWKRIFCQNKYKIQLL